MNLFNGLLQTWRTLQVWQWGLLFLVPPAIFALYFLKLKRQPLEVPSTYLWQRTIEDLHVNSLWQKLRQSLLLLLQILFVLLLLLACFNPSWQSSELSEDRFIFIVDNSASMSATDVEPTRLEEAKSRVRKLVEAMDKEDVAMLISTADRAKIEQAFTRDKKLLLRRLDAIEPTQRTSSLDEALQIADGLANPTRSSWDATDEQAAAPQPAALYIYSDGGFRTIPKTAMGHLKPKYIPVGLEASQNVAITAFDASQPLTSAGQTTVFARMQNFGTEPQAFTATLYLAEVDGTNERVVDAEQSQLDPGDSGGVEFQISNVTEGRLRLQLEIEDHLKVDNTAYAVINPPRQREVLVVTPGLDPLTTILSTESLRQIARVEIVEPAFLTSKDFQNNSSLGKYDLVIFDRCEPPVMPQSNTMFIGAIPTIAKWKAGPRVEGPVIIDTAKSHPLMSYVDMTRVLIAEGNILEPPAGGQTLVDSPDGPLMAIAPRSGFEDVVIGFPILTTDEAGATLKNTEWPIRPSFPSFIDNVLSYLAGAAVDQEAINLVPGTMVKVRWPTSVERVTVATPDGKSLLASRSVENSFVFGSTDRLGIYVTKPEKSTAAGATPSGEDASNTPLNKPYMFAVNLFDGWESDIRPKELIETQFEEIQASATTEPIRRELWKYVLLVGLAIMLFEWYVYNRRVYL